MTSPIAETIKTQLRELNPSELVEIQELIEYLLENFVEDGEDDLPLKPNFRERLERFQRGDYTTMDFDDAMTVLDSRSEAQATGME